MTPDFWSVRISPRLTRIHDPLDVQMYLVQGDERGLLIDTGFGVGDLPGMISSLTDKPFTVVLTHAHLDHAFGAGWFPDVRMSRLDHPVLAEHAHAVADIHADARRAGRPVAPEPNADKLGDLEDGDTFDLGGVTVRAIAAPGHTPGSMALLVEEERILITGDAANGSTFLFVPGSSTVTEYRTHLAGLAHRTAGSYDRVLISHGTGEAPWTLLADLEALCERVQARTDDQVPFTFMGMDALVARRPFGAGPFDTGANLVYDPARI